MPINHNQLFNFAVNARVSLMGIIQTKLNYVLQPDSEAIRSNHKGIEPLKSSIKDIGEHATVEKVAYTWFNRFCALRYMEVRGFTNIKVVSPATEQDNIPEVLSLAKSGYLDTNVLSSADCTTIKSLLVSSDSNRENKVYKILLISYCNWYHKQMPFLFEGIEDYTELLLPDNLLSPTSVLAETIQALNQDSCEEVETIGWLYQYYISDRKAEVDKKVNSGKKVLKEDMAPKTQLFTPRWIVNYMVQNSLGKLWLNSHPNPALQQKLKYYLESAPQEDSVKQQLDKLKNPDLQPQEIKFLDPCCGSGHILVVAFHLFMEMYKQQGWQEYDIPEMILKNNLFGLDICPRAAQLAQFALMMTARQYDRDIFNKVHELNICALQDTNWIDENIIADLSHKAPNPKLAKEQITLLKDTFYDAQEYGSIIKVSGIDFDFWQERLNYFNDNPTMFLSPKLEDLKQIIKQAKIMQQQYEVCVTNPPYLGRGHFSSKLSVFVDKNYPISKMDLFAVFKEVLFNWTAPNYFNAAVNQTSWMFLSSYEKLRKFILDNTVIDTMVHLGSRAFEAISGEVVQSVTYITRKSKISEYTGCYVRLTEYKNAKLKEEKYLERNPKDIYTLRQNKFFVIPGSRIAYWISDRVKESFATSRPLSAVAKPCVGLQTADNNRFLRLWEEVNISKIGFGLKDSKTAQESRLKWFPYNKGGKFRKWYGNNEYIVNWENDGYEIRNFVDKNNKQLSRPQNTQYYFKESATGSFRGSSFSVRFSPTGFIFDVAGSSIFGEYHFLRYIIGFLCSKLSVNYLKVFNDTFNFQVSDVSDLPVILTDNTDTKQKIENLVTENIAISKDDWDSFETSWDFQLHPLLRFSKNGLLKDSFATWQTYKQEQFNKLKSNEEELNRLFIEIYGLQDELTPEVPKEEVTVALADKKRDIKSLLSYAVGCMFGRYSLDKQGLIYAGGDFNINNYQKFKPCTDNVLPVLNDKFFDADIVSKLKEFLTVAFGKDTLAENLQYIACALKDKDTVAEPEKEIRNYFCKEFFKDHCQVYQKRPVYWLFTSAKGNFAALIYLHRYTKDTPSMVLSYLRNYKDKLTAAIKHNETTETDVSLSSQIRKKAQKDKNTYMSALNEVTSYDRDILYPLASRRLEIDLDDGVLVNYLKFGKALKDFGLKAKSKE